MGRFWFSIDVVTLAASFSIFWASAAAFAPLKRSHSDKPWTPAAATPHAEDVNRLEWSPQPTAAPAQDSWGEMELLKRQFVMGTNTCGFLSGYSSVAITCAKESAYCTDDGRGNRDCCTGEYRDCTSSMFSACLDFSASEKGACAGKGPRTLCCWAASPSCYTLLFSTSASPDKAFSLYQCASAAGLGTILPTPPAFARATTTTSSMRTSSSTTDSSTSGNSPTSSTPPDNGSSSSAPVGAIVGGVIGGVAVLGIFAFVIAFLVIRNRRNQGDSQQPTPSTVVQSPQDSYMSGYQSLPQQLPSPYKPYEPFLVQQTPQKPYDPVLQQSQHLQQYHQPFSDTNSPPVQQPVPSPPATFITELPVPVALGTEGRRAELD